MGILISSNYKLYCEKHHTRSVTELCIAMYNNVIANLFQTLEHMLKTIMYDFLYVHDT